MAKKRGRRLDVRVRKLAKGIIEGKTAMQAAIDAGYSPNMARAKSYEIIRRPAVQSMFTDALERAGLTTDQIVKPLIDGLQACIVVKDSKTLRAKKTRIGAAETRMEAASRLIQLHGGMPREVEMPPPPPPGLTVNIGVATGAPPPVPVIAERTEEGASVPMDGGAPRPSLVVNIGIRS